MLVRVLGSIEVRSSPGQAWTQPTPQQRLVLALLVAQAGRPCSADRLVHALWGEEASEHASRLVQGLVSRLRGLLEHASGHGTRLRTVPSGWTLALEADEIDAARFEQVAQTAAGLVEKGYRDDARRALEEAAELWRGRPFGELADQPALVGDTIRLEEQWLAARERLLRLRLDAGEHAEVVGALQELVAAHPLRERLWALLLQALYRSGRQADALAAYRGVRDRLVAELGAEPGPQLQQLHASILRHELPTAVPVVQERPSHLSSRRPVMSWPCRRDLPLVGRSREVAVLDAALARARGGWGQLVLVAGEPGIGKTRLVAELADTVPDDGVQVLAGRCTEGAAVPYEPFVEALRCDVENTAADRLVARLGRGAGELARLLPELADQGGWTPASPSLSAELDQHRLFDAVNVWLARASAEAPLLLVLEDLHAATRPTLSLLGHAMRATPTNPVMIVATYRDTGEEMSSSFSTVRARLIRRPNVTEVRLAGLDQRTVAALLADRHPDLAGEEGWAETVHAATAGNPLFVEELLCALDEGRPDAPEGLLQRATPHGVGELVQARIRRLSPATVALLQHAAVAGDRFDFAEVAEAAALTEREALDALEEASERRLVSPVHVGGDQYRFVHGLMRSGLLDATTPSRRLRLHARLAATLEARHADDLGRVASRLAHHYTAAGPEGRRFKTLAHTVAAGDAAMDQRAYEDASACYERALDLLEPGDDEQRCDVLLRLGQAQSGAAQPDHHATLLRALRLAVDRAEPERVAHAAFAGSRGFFSQVGGVDAERVVLLHEALDITTADHPGPRALVLVLLANELLFTADLRRRRHLTDEALRLARQQTNPTVLGRVLALRALTIQHPATLPERLHETAELIGLARRLGDPLLETMAQSWRFLATLESGNPRQAEAAMGKALRVAGELGHPMIQAFVLTLDVRELIWGDLDRAEHLAEHYHALGRQAGMSDVDCPYLAQQFILHRERGRLVDYLPLLDRGLDAYGMQPAWQAVAGLVRWLTGDHEQSLELLDRYAADNFSRVPHDIQWSDALCLFSELASLAGRHDAAHVLLGLLRPYHDRLSADPAAPLGAVAHYLGLLAITLRDWHSAEGYLREAADIHRKIGAHRWRARTLLAWARMLHDRGDAGDHAQATRLLREVAGWARRHGHGGLHDDAEQLAGARPAASSTSAGR